MVKDIPVGRNTPEDFDLTPTLEKVRPDQIQLATNYDGSEKSYLVNCCGEMHRIWAYNDGAYILEDHPLSTEEDREVWKALESLGDDAPMCFRVWKTSPKQKRLRAEYKQFLK